MKAADIPTIRFSIPFADLASVPSLRREIPVDSQIGITDGAASLQTGFPPLNSQPKASGGVPPFGSDVNGILYETTAWTRWYNAAAAVTRDAGFVTDIGGYPEGAVIPSALLPGWYWRSVVDDNLVDPDLGADAGWVVDRRVRLQSNLTIYVATTGSDSTFGLSSGSPFLTLQAAWDFCQSTFDLNGYSLTIQVAAGTYTAGLAGEGSMVGAGTVTILGDATTPSNCVISTSGSSLSFNNGAAATVSGFKLVSSAGSCLVVSKACNIVTGSLEYGVAAVSHIIVANGGILFIGAAYTISGSAGRHFDCGSVGLLQADAGSFLVSLIGTPAFTTFAFVQNGSLIRPVGLTFTGSATGARYFVSSNSTIDTSGGGANFFPGSTPGATSTGGQYV